MNNSYPLYFNTPYTHLDEQPRHKQNSDMPISGAVKSLIRRTIWDPPRPPEDMKFDTSHGSIAAEAVLMLTQQYNFGKNTISLGAEMFSKYYYLNQTKDKILRSGRWNKNIIRFLIANSNSIFTKKFFCWVSVNLLIFFFFFNFRGSTFPFHKKPLGKRYVSFKKKRFIAIFKFCGVTFWYKTFFWVFFCVYLYYVCV